MVSGSLSFKVGPSMTSRQAKSTSLRSAKTVQRTFAGKGRSTATRVSHACTTTTVSALLCLHCSLPRAASQHCSDFCTHSKCALFVVQRDSHCFKIMAMVCCNNHYCVDIIPDQQVRAWPRINSAVLRALSALATNSLTIMT